MLCVNVIMDFLLVSLFLASCHCCAMGVKTSLTLGREEKSWGEGVSWAPTSSRENSSMCGEDLVIKFVTLLPCYCIMGGIRRYGRR